MPHLPRGLPVTLCANEFVIAPEGAVEEKHVGRVELFKQRVIHLRDSGHVGETLARSLLDRFGSVRAVFEASEEELKKVPKIGDIKAAEIVRLSNSPYEGDQKRIEG